MDQIERPWSPEEDEMLDNLVKKHGDNWSLISKSIPGRSTEACELRWLSLLMSFTPEEDEMLLNLIEKHGRNWSLISNSIPGRSAEACELRWLLLQRAFTPEEDEMLLNLLEKHGRNWSLISNSIPGRSAEACELRWFYYHRQSNVPEDEETNDDMTIRAQEELLDREHKTKNYLVALEAARGQAPSIDDMPMDNVSQPSRGTHSYRRDQSAPSWNALNKQVSSGMMIDSDNVQQFVGSEFGSQNSIQEGNSSHDLGGVGNGQPPSISDMARANMSSGGTHSFSRDPSAPSWNALYIRDSSPMMTDSESVQQFVGSKFGRNDFSEVSSTSIVHGKLW